MKYSLTPGLLIERVGEDVVVIVPGRSDVVSLTGPVAKVLLDVKADQPVNPTDPALSHLVDLGIVTSAGVSRRGLIKAGAVGTGAGIAVMAMPTVAAASSPAGVGFSAANPILLNGTILGRPNTGTPTSRIYELQASNWWGVSQPVPSPSYPPAPFPTSGLTINSVSSLALTGTWDVGTTPLTLATPVAGGGADPYLLWGDDSNRVPSGDIIGTFTWDGTGADGRIRYYRVTFKAGTDTEPS